MNTELQLKAGETEVMSSFANKTGFLLSAEGLLVLTSQRLLFCHRNDKSRVKWECELADITFVGSARNVNIFAFLLSIARVVNLTVRIALKNGDRPCFVVPDEAQWISTLNDALAKLTWEWRTILS